MNCGALGALLIPLIPQRCDKMQSLKETVKLLEQDDIEKLTIEKLSIMKEVEQEKLASSRNEIIVQEEQPEVTYIIVDIFDLSCINSMIHYIEAA